MEKSSVYSLAMAFFSVLAIVCSYLASYAAKREQQQKDAQPPQWAADATTQLKRMEGRLGNEEMTHNYLAIQRKLTQQYAGAMSGPAVGKFMDSKDERDRLRESIRQANAQLLTSMKFRIQPINDLFLGMMDGWVRELKHRGVKMEVKTGSEDCVVDDTTLRGRHIVREISFQSGAVIRAFLVPAFIEDGRLVYQSQIAVQYDKPNGSDGEQCYLLLTDKRYELSNSKPARYTFVTFGKTNTDLPAEDEAFLSAIRTAVDQVMAHLVGDANAGI